MTSPNLPQHIAIVMDGNGRWAKQRFLPRIAGHRAGVRAVRQVIKNCVKRGIGVLSLFAFSSENWARPQDEVSYLMELLLTSLEKEVDKLHENQIRLRFIGDRSRFNHQLIDKITEIEKQTAAHPAMTLVIAADYGGRWDICQAASQLLKDQASGLLATNEVLPELFAARLSCADLPDPDLFIRTSGEMRISNFMLWQLAYTELYFSPVLWPDFNEDEFESALAHYASRERRYGSRVDKLENARSAG